MATMSYRFPTIGMPSSLLPFFAGLSSMMQHTCTFVRSELISSLMMVWPAAPAPITITRSFSASLCSIFCMEIENRRNR